MAIRVRSYLRDRPGPLEGLDCLRTTVPVKEMGYTKDMVMVIVTALADPETGTFECVVVRWFRACLVCMSIVNDQHGEYHEPCTIRQ